MTKRLLNLFIILAAIFALYVYISGVTLYQPGKALDYASTHWADAGSDVQFVSQCLHAGGCNVSPKDDCTTLLKQLKQRVGRNNLVELTIPDSGQISASENSNKIAAGDPIFFFCDTEGKYIQVTLCSGQNVDGYITAYAHNYADKPVYITHCSCGGKTSAYAFRMKSVFTHRV